MLDVLILTDFHSQKTILLNKKIVHFFVRPLPAVVRRKFFAPHRFSKNVMKFIFTFAS